MPVMLTSWSVLPVVPYVETVANRVSRELTNPARKDWRCSLRHVVDTHEVVIPECPLACWRLSGLCEAVRAGPMPCCPADVTELGRRVCSRRGAVACLLRMTFSSHSLGIAALRHSCVTVTGRPLVDPSLRAGGSWRARVSHVEHCFKGTRE